MEDELEPIVDGGSDEPAYDIPAGVGQGNPPEEAAVQATAETSEIPPVAPPAPAPGAPAAPVEPVADPVLSHPAVQAVLATLQRQNAALEQALLRQNAPRADAPPAPAPVERPEEDIELENRMLERVPFLKQVKDLVESPHYQHLLGMAERAPQFNQTINQFHDDVATQARHRLVESFAVRRGLEPSAVAADDANALIDTFLSRLGRDQRLVARFNAGDLRVVDEVMGREYSRWGLPEPPATPPAPAAPVVTPAASSAALAARAGSARHLPRSGGNALPPPSGVPVVTPEDEDAVHGAAWNALQGLRAPQ